MFFQIILKLKKGKIALLWKRRQLNQEKIRFVEKGQKRYLIVQISAEANIKFWKGVGCLLWPWLAEGEVHLSTSVALWWPVPFLLPDVQLHSPAALIIPVP